MFKRYNHLWFKTLGCNERIVDSMVEWFGHIEIIRGNMLVKKVYTSEMSGKWKGKATPI